MIGFTATSGCSLTVRGNVLDDAAALGPRDAVLVWVLAYAGLRPGEALAMRWADVRERTLLINAPKTNSTRTVRLLGPLAQDLAERRMRSGRPGDKSLVFPRRDGDPWTDTDWRNWRKRRFAVARQLGHAPSMTLAAVRPTALAREHAHPGGRAGSRYSSRSPSSSATARP